MAMDTEIENICCSGGALGADAHWGICAQNNGHKVLHFSFPRHKADTQAGEVIVLSKSQLEEADVHLQRANKTLKRKWQVKNPHVTSLLRRNFFQVRWSDSLYAVSSIDGYGFIKGGTAWAVQMMIDMHPGSGIYVFDQNVKQWYQWKGGWTPITKPPKPNGTYAGIGTRDLNFAGTEAISSIYK